MRALRLLVVLAITAGTVAAPTVTPVWAAPRPVEPELTTVSMELPGGGEAAPAATTPEFTAVGITLPAGSAVAVQDVQVRVREGGGWGEWTTLDVPDGGPDPDSEEGRRAAGRVASSPVFAQDANGVQVRPEPGSPAAASSRGATDVDVVLVDPGTSPADSGSLPAATATGATARPAIMTRRQWGADESLVNCTSKYSGTIKAAVVHHTAGSNSYQTQADAMRQLRADYAYHTRTLGWCDLGYNFVVDKFGTIYEGRSGGVDRPVVGAHAGGFNKDTFGVSMLGNYDTVGTTPQMRAAVAAITAWKLSIHDRNPWGTTTLTSAGGGTSRYAAGRTVTLPVVMGHRDVGMTACPGRHGVAILSSVRDVAAKDGQNADYSRALYSDMLGRNGTEADIAGWTGLISATGDRWIGAQGFTASEEYRRRTITGAYLSVLGRNPDAAGLEGWLEDVEAGRATLDDLPRRLMLSPEFYAQGGGTDQGFVNQVYRRALFRNAASSEINLWAREVRDSGRVEAVRGIYDSYESSLHRVNRSYQTWLRRAATAMEQEYWSGTVVRVGNERMRESAMVSPEYLTKARARF